MHRERQGLIYRKQAAGLRGVTMDKDHKRTISTEVGRRFDAADERLKAIQETIKPFVKTRRLVRAVAGGEWSKPSAAMASEVPPG